MNTLSESNSENAPLSKGTVSDDEFMKAMWPILDEFVNGMRDKLLKNKHKRPPSNCNAEDFLRGAFEEMLEVHEQFIRDRYDPNFKAECCDVANWVFLLYLSVRASKVVKN